MDQATGDLYVVYYDSRNFPANDSAEVYISVSTDGGQTFGDILVSDVPFLPRPLIRNDAGRAYMGSYIGISALQGIVWPCWMDNRTGIHQAYTSRVVFSDTSAPPMIGVSPETLDFGNVFVDSSKTLGLYVRNRVFSPDTLFVTDIHSDSATFTPDITSFSLPGANSRKVNIAFNPLSVGLKTATLTITSNDTAHPVVTVALRAYVLPITPTLVSPPNGAINQPITPTLIWTSTGASSYHLQVSTSSSFTTTVYDNSTIADTSRQIGPLAGLTRYYWKVSAKVNEVNSPYSQSRYFFTGIAPPSPPILASPANDTTNQPTTLTLHWNASALASTYHLQVSTDSTFAAPFLEDSSLTSTSRQVGGLASETKYFWRVQAKNSGGISDWSSVWNFTTGAREVTRQFTVGDRWNIISLPVQVDNNLKQNLFPTAASNAFAYEGTAGYMQKDTLLEGSGYWIKFGATQTISITGVPITSDSIAVGEGWNLIGSISEPIAAAQVFSIPSGLITSQFFGYQGVYVVSDTIQPGKGYWVKVSQTGKLILSSSSLARASNRIRIVPTSELPPPPPDGEITNLQSQIPSHFALEQNYPNPFNPSTIIRYQLPVTGYVTLKVYNVLGQEVATLVNEVKQPGRYSVEWNGSGHPSGVYLYRLHVRKFSETKKLLLVK
ncbi:MAG: T9SS type A sorting domain-containing protein [Ignavibacteriae bacterium]|nr:T9SS type A sorting domain-containing protein [Ignavibacteriota bacterium]